MSLVKELRNKIDSTQIPEAYFYKQIVEAKLFIDQNFRQKIDLELMASHACFSKFHFHRVFKNCYGKTPHQYLTFLRINEAKKLLLTNVSTNDVCDLVGFESTSTFIKLFRKFVGTTPHVFSKMNQKMKATPLSYIPSDYAEYLGWKH